MSSEFAYLGSIIMRRLENILFFAPTISELLKGLFFKKIIYKSCFKKTY